jgi:peptidoglycan/xylan/chitin deacetylase (PgdA/CDA1 family)
MRIRFVIALILSGVAVEARAQSPGGEGQTMCWTPDQLRGTAAEIAPRAGAPGARVAPPGQPTAPFTATPAALRGAIRRVTLPEGKKLVALTFDLCEAGHEIAGYDGRIIDYLRDNGVKATFFTGGKWLLTHPERTRQLIADPQFEMANHGWRHANFRNLAGKSLHDEIGFAQAAYEKMRAGAAERRCLGPGSTPLESAPERMRLLRFPYGTCSPEALGAVAEAGLLAVQWDVATGDPDPHQSARTIASRVLRSVRPGSIILGHANGRGWRTADALPLFVPVLRNQGYEFVTVSELLAAGQPEIVNRCYDLVAGDTERWVAARNRSAVSRPASGSGSDSDWNPFRQ